MKKHRWICDDCGHEIDFRLPEFPEGHYRSEQNEDKACPKCGLGMYFDEIEERGKLIVPGTKLNKLLQEDDTAPDAFVTFNREFQKITGLAVSEFEKAAETAHSDTFFRWTKGVYVLEYHADDPFHLLSEILPEAKNDKNT